ncbi:MAG: two-component regulator propeller domain-containing protein [Bacteroidota bacterium]
MAQTTRIQEEVFTVNDGLAHRYITDIVQDKRGLLWLGTEGGLNLFDGYQFKTFNTAPDGTSVLSSTYVHRLEWLKDDRLLVTYRNIPTRIDLMHPTSFEVEQLDLTDPELINGRLTAQCVTRSGELFIITTYRDTLVLHQWNSKQHGFDIIRKIPIPDFLANLVFQFYITQNGDLWIKTEEPQLWKLGANSQWYNCTPSEIRVRNLYKEELAETIFFEDGQHRLWVSFTEQGGLFVKTPDSDTLVYASGLDKNLMYNRAWEDSKGNLLVLASERHWLYARSSDVFLLDKNNQWQDFNFLLKNDQYLLSVTSRDFYDVIYTGMDPGFKIVKNNYSTVQTYLDVDLKKALYTPVMRGIVEGENGIIYTAQESRFWLQINTHTGKIDTIPLRNEQGNIMYPNCTRNLVLQGDYLWGSSCQQEDKGYLIRYHIPTKETKIYYIDYKIDYLFIDTTRRFWLVAGRGEDSGILLLFNPETGGYAPYNFRETVNPIANVHLIIMYETLDGDIWIGTTGGLYQLDHQTSEFKLYSQSSDSNMASDYIMDIHEDETGKLWLGTNGGLCVLDRKTQQIKKWQKKDGLPSNVVCGILPDGAGKYWLSTHNGLSYFDAETELFRNFYATDGLTDNEFNKLSKLHASDDKFYFGGINGINSFVSEELLQQRTPPAPLLTNIVRFDTSRDTIIEQNSQLDQLSELVISPAIDYFQIDFVLPHIINPSKNQFQIKLEGLDEQWIYIGNQHNVRYNFLPHGTYTLKIRGADSKGNWSTDSRDLDIIVQQVFYKKWWFITLCGLAIGGLLIGLQRYQHLQQLRVEQLRTKISSDLHDEVSGLLSGIAMQTDIIQAISTDDKIVNRLQKIGTTSRSAMSKMSDVIWSIDSRKDHIEDLLHRMNAHAEELLDPLDIEYDFEIKNIVLLKKLSVILRQNLYFIFKECINNIAKHSNATQVNIVIKNTDKEFIMSISDNGNSSNKTNTKSYKGQGMSNLQMRAKRINARLIVDDTDGFQISVRRKKL